MPILEGPPRSAVPPAQEVGRTVGSAIGTIQAIKAEPRIGFEVFSTIKDRVSQTLFENGIGLLAVRTGRPKKTGKPQPPRSGDETQKPLPSPIQAAIRVQKSGGSPEEVTKAMQTVAKDEAQERIKDLKEKPRWMTPKQARKEMEKRFGKNLEGLRGISPYPQDVAALSRIARGTTKQDYNGVLAGIIETELNSPDLWEDLYDW